jgi:acetyl esterase/lipase
MAAQDASLTPVRLAAREIPPPSTISPAAQKILSDNVSVPRIKWPPADDKEAWRKQLATVNPAREQMALSMLAGVNASIETKQLAGVVCYDCRPNDSAMIGGIAASPTPAVGMSATGSHAGAGEGAASSGQAPVYLFMHGGAFVVGGGMFAKAQGGRYASATGVRVISVDYRMPPDHPFPAAPEDCVAVYKALIETTDPKRVVIGGSSAGGNIAAVTTLMIRDRGLPMPGGVILLTPEADLTESGDTFRTNADIDVVIKGGFPECNALYANGHDLRDPYVSPLFGDFTKGFPPTFVQTGTRDLFLSNSVRIHRKLRDAGVDAELHVWEAMPHGGFIPGEAPENAEIQAEVARFIRRVIG